MKIHFILSLLAMLALGQATVSAFEQPVIQQLTANDHIMVVGDSTTAAGSLGETATAKAADAPAAPAVSKDAWSGPYLEVPDWTDQMEKDWPDVRNFAKLGGKVYLSKQFPGMILWLPDLKEVRGVYWKLDRWNSRTPKPILISHRFALLRGDTIGRSSVPLPRGQREPDDALPKRMQALLDEFATMTGHPELSNVPLFCAGIAQSTIPLWRLLEHWPARILGVSSHSMGGWVPDFRKMEPSIRNIPAVYIFPSPDDGVRLDQRAPYLEGSRSAFAMGWEKKHHFSFGNFDLALPYFDQIVRLRYPAGHSLREGPPKLRDLAMESGCLVDTKSIRQTLAVSAPFAEFKGDRTTAGWMPNAYMARLWQGFNNEKPLARIVKPGTASVDKNTKSTSIGWVLVPVAANEPVTMVAEALSDTVTEIEFFDGDRSLGKGVGSGQTFTLEGARLPAGARGVLARAKTKDGQEDWSRPALVFVSGEISRQ